MLNSNQININLDATNKVETNMNDASFTVNVGNDTVLDVNLNTTDKLNVALNEDNFIQIALTGGGTGPKGDTGDVGPAGLQGIQGIQGIPGPTGPSITNAEFNNNDIKFTKSDGTTVILQNAKINLKGDTGLQGIQGIQGLPGIDGEGGTIEIGTVTTVDYNVPAAVTNIGTPENAILDIDIPKGKDGLGVPDGGTFNQVLAKLSDQHNDTAWIDIVGAVSSVNDKSGIVVLNADDIDDTYTTHKFATGENTGDETTYSIQTKLGEASDTTSGYLTSQDWNKFNDKQELLIEGVDYPSMDYIQDNYIPFKNSVGDVELGGLFNVRDSFSVQEEEVILKGLKISNVNGQIWFTM